MTGPTRNRLFLGGQSISLLGDGLAVLAVPLLVLHLTHQATAAALAASPRTFGYLISGLVAGPLVDRSDPRHVLIAADAVRAVVFFGLFGLACLGTGPVGVILVLAFAAGVAGVFFESALAIAVRDLYRGRELLRANSFLETANQTSVLVGPGLVGILALLGGTSLALLVNALTFVISLSTLGFLPRGTAAGSYREPLRRSGLVTDFWAGLRHLASHTILIALTTLLAIVNICQGVETLVVFFASDRLHASPLLTSFVVAGGGLGGALGAATATAIAARYRPAPVCSAAMLLVSVALTAAGLAPNAWCLLIANAGLVWASALASIVVRTLRQQLVPREFLGRATSVMRAVLLAAAALGTVAAGLSTQLLGGNPRPVFIAAALLVAVFVALIWALGLRRHRNTPIYHSEDMVTA
ncbi:MFS transporter [Nocardia sp. 2YAB30]|uniref:MFS transporter n=1 Tax=unclassified Nocardia TaxID=2637762 RepID=UPI003F98D1BF